MHKTHQTIQTTPKHTPPPTKRNLYITHRDPQTTINHTTRLFIQIPSPPKTKQTPTQHIITQCCVSHTHHTPQIKPQNSTQTPQTNSLSHSTTSQGKRNESKIITTKTTTHKHTPPTTPIGKYKTPPTTTPTTPNHPIPLQHPQTPHTTSIKQTQTLSPTTPHHTQRIQPSQL